MIQLDEHIFSKGLVTTTKKTYYSYFMGVISYNTPMNWPSWNHENHGIVVLLFFSNGNVRWLQNPWPKNDEEKELQEWLEGGSTPHPVVWPGQRVGRLVNMLASFVVYIFLFYCMYIYMCSNFVLHPSLFILPSTKKFTHGCWFIAGVAV